MSRDGGTAARRHRPLALVLLAVLAAGPAVAVERLLDGIAAQVGTDIVLLSDVEEIAGPIAERLRKAGAPESEILALRADALDRLIDGRLVARMVERLELGATDDEIDRAIAAIAKDTGIPVAQLARSVVSHGLTLHEYRVKLQTEIERSKVINAVVLTRVHVDEQEVRAIYRNRYEDQPVAGTEVHVKHILIGFGADFLRPRDSACAMAAEARQQILSGERRFDALAAEISNANRSVGGDLGWIHQRDLAAWMSQAIEGLAPGELSPVIDTNFGCNLLQLVDRRSFKPVTFEEAAPAIHEQLFRQKTEEQYSAWIDELRANTYIDRKGGFAEATRLMRAPDEPSASNR